MKLIYSSALCCYLAAFCCLPSWSFAQTSSGYCMNKGTRSNTWLQKVSIGNWSSNTGGNSGYLYQADSKLVLSADTSYAIQLELGGYPRVQDSAYWRVWIDLNQDLDFGDEGEQVFQSKTVFKGVAKGTLKLPRLFEAKKYMLRIVVAKSRFSPPCGERTTIEIEDYLAEINPAFACITPVAGNILIDEISDSEATLSTKDLPGLKYKWHVESVDGSFSKDYSLENAGSIVLEDLKEKTNYKVRLKIECAEGESRWSSDVTFSTLAKSSCLAPNKRNILIEQLDRQSARLTLKGAEKARVEWRYRIKGKEKWLSLGGPNIAISFPAGSDTLEAQARLFCEAQNVWTNWSELVLADVSKCLFPDEKNVIFYTYFPEYPSLRIFVHFAYTSYYDFRWYYREKGEQSWIDTLTLAENIVTIANLSPGKTYEVRVDVHCGKDSISLYKTVQVDPVCLDINASQLTIGEVYDNSAQVLVTLSGARTLEYRYRKSGETEFKITRFKGGLITGLEPLATYELNVRVVCEDSIPNWSPPVFFTTKGCKLPYKGDLSIVQSYAPDSIRYRADFINFSGPENFQFYWSYKATDEKNWERLGVLTKNEVLLKRLQKGTKYNVELSVRCSSNAKDSFSLTSSFTAIQDVCLQKPDTAAIILRYGKGSYPTLIFKSPRKYAYDIRIKSADSTYFRDYFWSLQDEYYFSFSIFPGINDFQYRYICPSGNHSPWSDVIKIDNTSGFIETELLQLAIEDEKKELQDPAKMHLRITPNPSSGQLSILFPKEMESQPEAHLEILNTAGQRIWSLKTTIAPAQILPLDLSKQIPGLYILRIQSGSKVYTERIIIGSNR